MSKSEAPQLPKFESLVIEDFSPGLNTLYDPRQLQPNVKSDVQEGAESPYMQNIDIVAKGSIITSKGFLGLNLGLASGPIKGLFPYIKDPATKYMIFFTDLNVYYFTPSDSSAQSVGSLLTEPNYVGVKTFVGSGGVKYAIIGTDNNELKQWDGASYQSVANAPAMSYIMESFKGHLFIANGKTLYYCATRDQTVWDDPDMNGDSGTIGFDDDITGIKAFDDYMVVYTRYLGYVVKFTDIEVTGTGDTLAVPTKHPERNTSGCLAYETVTPVYNDIYALSTDGIQRFGADAQFIAQNFRVNSLSWKINPSVLPEAYNSAYVSKAAAIYFQKKFYLIVPYNRSFYNSQIFVYNYDYNSWSARNGILASNFAVLPNEDGQDELYFGNDLRSEINKFTPSYDYNLFGYERIYKTKIFTMGNGMRSKFWQYIDIKGAMYLNTKFYVDLTVDGMTKTYFVDNTTLDVSSAGGYYGDDYYGDQTYGGPVNDSNFLRYGARIPFPVDIKAGRELQITFRNFDAGQPWKIDYLNIVWQWDDPAKVPFNYQSAQPTIT